MADIWARVDEAIDTDPLQLRGIVAELLARAETAEAAEQRVRAMAGQARGVFTALCCCGSCEDMTNLDGDRHSPRWTGWDLDPAAVLEALDAAGGSEGPADPLHASIECVLLDHRDELDGDNVDPNLAELAYVYRQRTGWTVATEQAADGAESHAERTEGAGETNGTSEAQRDAQKRPPLPPLPAEYTGWPYALPSVSIDQGGPR